MKNIGYYGAARNEIAKFIPKNTQRLLDIGCGLGLFSEIVKAKTGAETWGVEIIPEVAERAKEKVDNIIVGQIEESYDSLPNHYFDVITYNDVLEHLIDPWKALSLIKDKLHPSGIIIASIPNVRYFETIYNYLINKDWEYTDSGILDSTHLRFFTKKSMERMFEKAGLKMICQEGIKQTTTKRFKLFNLFTLGFFNDSKFMQYVNVAKLK